MGELFKHAHVLATNGTVHYLSVCPFRNGTSGAHTDRTVDHSQLRREELDISGCFTNKILNLERKAHVQNINL
jgi:hypothetical protein